MSGRIRLALFLTVGFLLVAAGAGAVPVKGLYQARVEVPDTSREAREPAMAEALRRVLVRVSGSPAVLEKEGVERLLDRAGSLAQSYRYRERRVPALPTVTGEEESATGVPIPLPGEAVPEKPLPELVPRLELEVTFGAVGVTRALAELGAPVWGANRPRVLLWLVVNEASGRSLVTGTVEPWAGFVNETARERGLPIVFPDPGSGLPSLSELWGGFMGSIRAASEPYQADFFALARVGAWGAGWQVRWSLHQGGERVDGGQFEAGSPGAVSEDLVARLARLLAQRYAINPGELENPRTVDLVVHGVTDLAGYARVQQALKSMAPVTSVRPTLVAPDRLRLSVGFRSELQVFREYLALDRRFVPIERAMPGPGSRQRLAPARPLEAPPDQAIARESSDREFTRLHPVMEFRWMAAGPASRDEGGQVMEE